MQIKFTKVLSVINLSKVSRMCTNFQQIAPELVGIPVNLILKYSLGI